MNKFFLFYLLFPCFIFSEDLKIADDFQEGDLISAETFNQIFDTIEKINRTIVTEDLVGTWSCDAMTTRQTAGWADKSLYYLLEDAQVNFGLASQGTTGINVLSTSSPSPFKRQSSSFSGEFSVLNNKLFTKNNGENESRIWSINFISESRFELTFLETSAQSFPSSYSSFITCDSTVAVPASPTSPSAVNDKGTITLTWTDSSNNEDGFKIYRKISSDSEYTLLATQSTVGYVDASAENGVDYNYYIVSYNSNGESAKSKIMLISSDSVSPFISLVNPTSGSSLSQLNDSQDQGFSITITLTFSELVAFFSSDRSANWPMTLYVNDVEINTMNAWVPRPLVPDPIHNTFSFGMVLNGYGDYKIIVHKDGIVDKNGNQMSEDLTINYTVSQN